jgi:putative flippase GtrA
MSLVRSKGTFWTFVRYLGVGGVSFVVDFACFIALVRVYRLDPAIAQVFSRTAGAASGFVGHKYFSFAQGDPGAARRRSSTFHIVGYLLVTLFGIVVSPFVIQLILYLDGHRLLIAKLCTEVVMVCINFVAMRTLFSHAGKKAEPLQ